MQSSTPWVQHKETLVFVCPCICLDDLVGAESTCLRCQSGNLISSGSFFGFTSCCWAKSNLLFDMYSVDSFISNLEIFSILGRQSLDVSLLILIKFFYWKKEKTKKRSRNCQSFITILFITILLLSLNKVSLSAYHSHQ